MRKIVLVLIPLITLLAVSFTTINNDSNKGGSVCDSINMSAQEHLVMSVVWYQKSAEMKALYYQGFNFARIAIDNKLKNLGIATKSAVVLDIDETVLDNSPYEAMMIEKGIPYSTKTWKEWTKLAKAKPTPGVVEFLNQLKSKGIEAFYVSNRDMDEREATLKNMLAENIPFADTTHLLLRVKGNSNKTDRYKSVEKNYKILLTIGDNLRDYNEIFSNRKNNYGMNMVDSLKTKFGEDFIILPNPMYGDWEKAVYGGKFPSEVEKSKLRKAAMVSY
jgi:5'-nucleotidase (lipoprotein e(P4) family)